WYDNWTNKFYIASNGKRTIAMDFSSDMGRGYYASEACLVRLAPDRVGLEYKEILEIPAMKILSWDLEGNVIVEDPAVDFQDPQTTYMNYGTAGASHGGKHSGTSSGSGSEVHKLWVYLPANAKLIPS